MDDPPKKGPVTRGVTEFKNELFSSMSYGAFDVKTGASQKSVPYSCYTELLMVLRV